MVSQNLQNNAKLKKYVCGDCTTVRRRKAAEPRKLVLTVLFVL